MCCNPRVLSRKGIPSPFSALAFHPQQHLAIQPFSSFSSHHSLLTSERPVQATALERQKAVCVIKHLINYWTILKRKSTFAQNSVYLTQMLFTLSSTSVCWILCHFSTAVNILQFFSTISLFHSLTFPLSIS